MTHTDIKPSTLIFHATIVAVTNLNYLLMFPVPATGNPRIQQCVPEVQK